VIKFAVSTIFKSQVMDCQIHVIEKAMRYLFAYPVHILEMSKYAHTSMLMY